MRHAPRRTASIAVALAALLGACGGDGPEEAAAEDAEGFPVTVDDCGREVTFEAPPERTVMIGVAIVENLYAIDAADTVVRRYGFGWEMLSDDARASVEDTEATAGWPSREAVLDAQADVLVGYQSQETDAEDLEEAGVLTVTQATECPGAREFEDVYTELETLGSVYGTRDRADEVVADLRDEVAAIVEEQEAQGEVTAAVAGYVGGFYLEGNQSFSHAVIEELGMENVFGDTEETYIYSPESLLDRDPDVIVLTYGWGEEDATFEDAEQRLLEVPGAAELTAVREGRVIGVPFLEMQGSPMVVEGMQKIVDAQAGG